MQVLSLKAFKVQTENLRITQCCLKSTASGLFIQLFEFFLYISKDLTLSVTKEYDNEPISQMKKLKSEGSS